MARERTANAVEFARTRLTLLAYGGAAIFGLSITSLGPAMPLLRADLDISRAVAGLHFTAVAAAAMTLGFTVDRVARRWGRRHVLWLGGASMSAGGIALALGHHPTVTVIAATLIGSGGTATLSAARSALADAHGATRTVALAEADAAWAAGAIVPGLMIGALVAAGLSWRLVFPLPALLWLFLYVSARRVVFPATGDSTPTQSHPRRLARLPTTYWMYWCALVPSAAAEWCITVWAAGFLVDEADLSAGSASFMVTAYFAAMCLGRLIGSRLARRISPHAVLGGAFSVAIAGTVSFWLSDPLVIRVVALFVTGLGVSLLFPMILSLAMGTASDSADAAAARVSIAAGGAMLLAPVTLGWVADRVGIDTAFVLVPILLVIASLLAVAARASRHPTFRHIDERPVSPVSP